MLNLVLTTKQIRTGQHPRQFGKDADGGVYHVNRKGNWVKLDPNYDQHKRLHAEASAALASVEASMRDGARRGVVSASTNAQRPVTQAAEHCGTPWRLSFTARL